MTSQKFDERSIDEASLALAKVAESIAEFDRLWKLLTPQEQAVTGGIIFNLHSVWEDKMLIGVIAVRPFATALLERLFDFHQSPTPMPNSNIITPEKKESN